MSIPADIGVVGLGVMGANLALNLDDHGNRVAVYNRTQAVTDHFMDGQASDTRIVPTTSLPELVQTLAAPRVLLLMVKAGAAVDAILDDLIPLLGEGDVVIDGGNSRYTDTERRVSRLAESGLHFLGIGVSGGEEGARHGPSIMPGGSSGGWPRVEAILKGIAAKAPDGEPCCEWVGPGGAGHFVKMVHNGIEYGDMQVIAEAYDLMRRGLGMSPREIAGVFASWNEGKLQSYLVEISAEILITVDEDGEPLIDRILDAAGQKGTGKWTVEASLELAQPTTLVGEAVYARIVSSAPEHRKRLSARFESPASKPEITVDDIADALYASKIVSYAQGFRLLGAASTLHDWDLDMGTIAGLWRAGCIIRARFLEDITRAFRDDPALTDLVESSFFATAMQEAEPGWRRVVSEAVVSGIPVPAYAAALTYFDGIRSERLPASLIQAQRDFFGAHTYERVDRPRGEFFHYDWLGDGGETPA